MKSNFFVQYNSKDVEYNMLIKLAKEEWKNKGNKVKDIKTLDLYYKPEEHMCYYVFNDDIKGKFEV